MLYGPNESHITPWLDSDERVPGEPLNIMAVRHAIKCHYKYKADYTPDKYNPTPTPPSPDVAYHTRVLIMTFVECHIWYVDVTLIPINHLRSSKDESRLLNICAVKSHCPQNSYFFGQNIIDTPIILLGCQFYFDKKWLCCAVSKQTACTWLKIAETIFEKISLNFEWVFSIKSAK